MTERIRGLWRARIIVALSKGDGHFNSLCRNCNLPNPAAASRVLRKLVAAGDLVHIVESPGPPLKTRWRITEAGRRLVPSAMQLIAQIGALHDERKFARSRPRRGDDPVFAS